jgi:uncharacterized protein
VCVLLAIAAGNLRAVDWKSLHPQGYVSDFAGVLDAQSKPALESYCASVERSTGSQMALVVVPSLEREPIEDAARTIFDAWGIGHKGKNDGILLLLAVADRRSHLLAGAGVKPLLPDDFANRVLADMRPALREQHYGEALLSAAQAIGSAIAQGKHVDIAPPEQRPVHGHSRSIPWPLIIGGIALVVWLMRAGGRSGGFGGGGGVLGFLPWLLLGNLMGRDTWGSRGSGGFGGSDSGDSFGGFGGGDSGGGGGVSGDW